MEIAHLKVFLLSLHLYVFFFWRCHVWLPKVTRLPPPTIGLARWLLVSNQKFQANAECFGQFFHLWCPDGPMLDYFYLAS